MRRLLAPLAFVLAVAAGCVVPVATVAPAHCSHHTGHPHAHAYGDIPHAPHPHLYSEIQHPLIDTEGHWRLMGDARFRAGMFEARVSQPLPKP